MNAPPSRNQAKDDTLAGLFDLFKAKFLQNTDDMLPAKVIAYDRATNRAQVQPLIVMVNTNNERISRAQIASVPVLQMGGGGFVISFPIIPGDLGWIKSNDRDISFFKKNYAESAPNTQRKHNFSDALFIPDSCMRNVTVSGDDAANLVIQNLDGTVCISIAEDKIKITAPAIELISTDTISMTAGTSITIDTPITTITGAITGGTNPSYAHTAQFNGDITTTGQIQATGNVTGSGTSLHTHTHGGVQTGGGNTGAPN